MGRVVFSREQAVSEEASHHFRRFRWGDVSWSVQEVRTDKVPDSDDPSSLIFASQNVVRRLRVFPQNWYELDDESLWRLGERSPVSESHIEALGPALPSQIADAAVALGRSRELLERAQAALTANARLKEVRRELIQHCRAQRLMLRSAVELYTTALLAGGVELEDARFMVMRSVRVSRGHAGVGLARTDQMERDAARWCGSICAAA